MMSLYPSIFQYVFLRAEAFSYITVMQLIKIRKLILILTVHACSVVSDSLQTLQTIQVIDYTQTTYGIVYTQNSWNSPGQNTGVGRRCLLQGIFPTQGSNPSLLHCRQILYQLSQQGSPRILKWVIYPFSSRSSQPRNQTRVSCIACRFFTS